MAENKKSFVGYADWKNIFEMLEDAEAGALIKHVLSYVNDEDPILEDRILKMAFEPIKAQLKRDLEKYKTVKERRQEAGRKGGIKSGETRKQNESNEANASFVKQSEANEAVNDSVNVNDNVTVNVNDNVTSKIELMESRKLKFASTLTKYNEHFPRSLLKEFYEYWTEPNKSGTKFKQELEKTWDLERRLNTWAKNDKNFSNGKSGTKQTSDGTLETNR